MGFSLLSQLHTHSFLDAQRNKANVKQVCALFYSNAGDCKFTCNKCGCSRAQATASGYFNLLSHLNAKHPGFMAEYEKFTRSTDVDLSACGYIDERTNEIYRWMQRIVERNHPLNEVDNPLTRSISRLKPISARTLQLYMQHVATSVGAAVATELGDTFGVMFDGWTNGPHHYVGFYGVCAVDGQLRQPLLALSPMESGQSADAHIELLRKVLPIREDQ
uniref:AlNc14C13G1600 protein n=1 Tax=Albugo laibachii Nc14 TaxID=890382 RepID=F0W3P0_9STRA|nr:AlNc14C13G1600 [Albugo laibachii Nc14]|eukprot:CCA15683.1 AlNc14C13G1600 [Albugo laibachii Nc14]